MPAEPWSGPAEVDVVVAGAGPVGLTLACLLADFGLEVVVLEAQPSCSDEPRAVSLVDESLRVLESIGVLDAIRADLVWNTGSVYHGVSGKPLVTVSPAAEMLGFPRKNCFDQPALQRALLDAAASRSRVTVSFDTAFSELGEDRSGLSVTATSASGAERRIRSRFLVGCDGGRSTVRDRCGIEMVGSSQSEPWIVLDLVNDSHRERASLFYCNPDRPAVVIPGTAGRCRYEFMLLPGETADDVLDIPFLEALLEPFRTLEQSDIRRKAVYVAHQLIATRWRVGNVFLAGDAAHLMPPFAGQGLNTGIRDAWNLAWKLAAVTSGRSPEALLDTYEVERRAHARAMVDLSQKMGRLIMTTDRRKAVLRDAVFQASRAVPALRRYFAEMRFVRPPRVDSGLIVRHPEAGPLAGSYVPQPLVIRYDGELVPFDRVLGRDWGLVSLGPSKADDSLAESLVDLEPRCVRMVSRRTIPSRSGLFEEVSDSQGLLPTSMDTRYLLVRPDRIIAADFTAAQLPQVLDGLTGTATWGRNRDSPDLADMPLLEHERTER